MAQQTIQVGAAPNDNTGDFIRDAFIKVNANFDELYSDDAGDVDSVNGQTGTVVLDSDDIAEGSTNEYYTEAKVSANTSVAANTAKVSNATHTGDVTGSTTLTIEPLAVTTSKIAADAVDGTKIADDSIDSEHYVDGSIDTAHIADNQITHDKLEARFTEKQDIATTSGTINLDASSYAIFELTGTLTTVTLNVQNMKKSQAIDILLSGTLSSAVITLSDNFTTSTINRVGSTELDTAATNIIQVLCIDDNDSAANLTYAIGAYAIDTTP
jgi:hypothetical protein